MAKRSRLGRPPKGKSDAIFTRRLQVMLSDDDAKLLNELVRSRGYSSKGHVIRTALRRLHKQLVIT